MKKNLSQNKRPEGDDNSDKQAGSPHDEIVDAIRHVGRTLESDPNYTPRESFDGYSTPEAQIAAEGISLDRDPRPLEQGQYDPATGELSLNAEPDSLHTRLPGDTSSDPHTDVGPDNATNLQERDDVGPTNLDRPGRATNRK